ncbi:Uncharacterised protein [Vibrio cholerae]|nr:Uncharacterised protein [Vibrio cholerae]
MRVCVFNTTSKAIPSRSDSPSIHSTSKPCSLTSSAFGPI